MHHPKGVGTPNFFGTPTYARTLWHTTTKFYMITLDDRNMFTASAMPTNLCHMNVDTDT